MSTYSFAHTRKIGETFAYYPPMAPRYCLASSDALPCTESTTTRRKLEGATPNAAGRGGGNGKHRPGEGPDAEARGDRKHLEHLESSM